MQKIKFLKWQFSEAVIKGRCSVRLYLYKKVVSNIVRMAKALMMRITAVGHKLNAMMVRIIMGIKSVKLSQC